MIEVTTREIKGRTIWVLTLTRLQAIDWYCARNPEPQARMNCPANNVDLVLWGIVHGTNANGNEMIVLADYTAERLAGEANAAHATAEAKREAAQRELDELEALGRY